MIPRNYTAMEGMRFRGESVLAVKDTPFGNLAVTERDGMITTYLDMNPLFGSQDLAMDEELVHYPALQRADPESFLIIGGTRAGIGKEVEKYDPAVFHICEPDRWIIRLTGDYINQDKAHILLTADGRNWLAREDCPGYDVVISTAGEPLTLGWNRYFTVEFFRLVHSRLNEGGVFAMQMPSAGNYLNEQGTDQLATVYEGLSAVFSNVLVIPGLATYFLASDQLLSMDFPSLLREHPIATTYVNPDYLDPVRMSFENGLIMETIGDRQGLLNRDLRPVLFFESLTSWNLRTGGRKLVNTGLVALLVLLLLFIAHSGRNMPMFVSGFTGAGSQILLILAAQSFYGFAYLVTPLMITVFMGGLVTGTRVAGRISFLHSARAESLLLGIFSLFAVLTALLLRTGTQVHGSMVGMAFLGLLNIVAGCLVGAVYTTSLKGSRGTAGAVAGNLYGADLAGAALGSFFPPLFLLPLTGVVNTFILFSGFCLVAALSHGLMRTGRGK
jgi:spermidine synthase